MCTLSLLAERRNIPRRRAARRGGPRSLCRQACIGFVVVLPLMEIALFDYDGIICIYRTG